MTRFCFTLELILDKYRNAPAAATRRRFVVLPPLVLHQWRSGNEQALLDWMFVNLDENVPSHILTVLWTDQHWTPFWIEPNGPLAKCHTLHFDQVDQADIREISHALSTILGYADSVTHWAPTLSYASGLCGAMAISFLAHIALGARIPRNDQQLRSRSWDMKHRFLEATDATSTIMPVLWGWSGQGESRLLPIMPAWDPFVSLGSSSFAEKGPYPAPISCHDGPFPVSMRSGSAVGHDEMWFHTRQLTLSHSDLMGCVITGESHLLDLWLQCFERSAKSRFVAAILFGDHWIPVLAFKCDGQITVAIEAGPFSQTVIFANHEWIVCELPASAQPYCGAATIAIFAAMLGYLVPLHDIPQFHHMLRHQFHAHQGFPQEGIHWGNGPAGQLTKNLIAELLKHGIPNDVVEARATAAIQALGSNQVMTALQHRQPWKQLKILGNNAKFQFVLPSELAAVVEANKGRPVGGKGKGKSRSLATRLVSPDLDPHKLHILDGTFGCQNRPMPQIAPTQVGPVSSGVILMTRVEAEPYLRAGKQVSQEPLALAVLCKPDEMFHTALPHVAVTIPCRCTIDHEPVLADAVLVQIGSGLIEKVVGSAVVHLESFDVVTLKILVYRDELKIDWTEFCQSPIRHLVQILPQLRRCSETGCTCPQWHNNEQLDLKDPILDVWRRQFLRVGFKPSPASKADMFSVCLRIPKCLLDNMLSCSGSGGAYCEPRSADGMEILPEFTVIWTPKHNAQEIQHLMRTNPAVTGLARLGDRRGLRVKTAQAKVVHDLVRPDSVFLPQGPKCQFSVGPMPYGVDRNAVAKMLAKTGWECRPLQPTTPCPGRGVMWLVQSTEEPSHSIVHTSHGEIVISKQKQDTPGQTARQTTVGSATTLALCKAQTENSGEADPWSKLDPWGGYKPLAPPAPASGSNESIQQLESRIQNAVMAKINAPMEDDLPDRVVALEGQVQQLLNQQQGFETQLQDFSSHHTQQLTSLQTQVNVQSQQLHGHLENQNQTIQSLYEQQMTQIRTLLSKRPREDGME